MNGVHKSLKAHDNRVISVAKGEMTKEEAKKLQRQGLVQDAAKVGLGVMSLQAAHAKWKEVEGGRNEYKEHKKEKRERDRKREEKRRSSEYGGGSRGHRARENVRDRDSDRDRDRDRGRDDGTRSHYRDGYHDGYRGRDRGLARRSEPDIRRYLTR
jgi:hypothetical protein